MTEEKPSKIHISLSGGIACGKTTFLNKIKSFVEGIGRAEEFSFIEENVDAKINPSLKFFYKDQNRFALLTQVFFLVNRIHGYNSTKEKILTDRCFQENEVFMNTLLKSGTIEKEILDIYKKHLQEPASEIIPYPDIIIFLNTDFRKCKDRLNRRGNEYEKSVGLDYLNTLNQCYIEWIQYVKSNTNTKVIEVDWNDEMDVGGTAYEKKVLDVLRQTNFID